MTDNPYNLSYAEVFARPAGPQLTEHTGNRIATALERIADAMESRGQREATQESVSFERALSRFAITYPLGDPAPIPTGTAT